MSGLKIAVVIDRSVPSQWAHSINTVKHAEGFRQLGHSTEILTVMRHREKQLYDSLESLCAYYGIEDIPLKFWNASPINYYDHLKPVRLLRRLLRAKDRLTKPLYQLAKHCVQRKVDLAYCRSYLGAQTCLESGVPVILETHATTISPQFERVIPLLQLPHAKGIVTISEILKELFISYGVPEEKILVREDAVEMTLFTSLKSSKETLRKELGIDPSKKVAMYLGSLKRGKAIHKLLEAARQCQDPNLLFYIVGGTEQEQQWWIDSSGFSYPSNLRFVPFQLPQSVPKWLKAADLLLLPYDLEETGRIMDINTTSPIKLFEYMASEVPIVASRIPATEKIVDEDEVWFSDPEKPFIRGISEVLAAPAEERQRRSKNAYAKAQHHTYRKRAEDILLHSNYTSKQTCTI